MSLIGGGQLSGFPGPSGSERFPDPFLDVASLSMPNNMRSAMYWCQYVYSSFNTYAMAMERILSYFLTDVEIEDAGEDEEEKWSSLLNEVIDVLGNLKDGLRDRACYGNGFYSTLIPFKRWLTCTKCGFGAPLSEVYTNSAFKFAWQIPDFTASCPACKKHRGPWKVDDRADDEEKNIRIKRWSPHEMELLHDHYTDDADYIWRIPEDYKHQIRKGHLYHLERCPMEVLKAIHKNDVYRFDKDAVFHFKEPTLGGIINRGWGIPKLLANWRQIYYVQVLRRFNEAIALDYVIPFRIITPAQRPGGGGAGGMSVDPMQMFNGGDFRNQIQNMIRRRRRDPASMQILPFPVEFQMFGADANQLAPRDLHDQALEVLLNDTGTPVELYKGTLQLQAAPVALRLFESTHHSLVYEANAFLRWLVGQVSQIMSWETVAVKLKRVTIADDLQKQMMAAQMMMSRQISGTTVLKDMGYSWPQEQKQLAEEDRRQAEIQARVQEEMQQSGFAQQIAKGQLPGQPQQGQGQPQQGGQPPVDGSAAGAMGTPMAGPVSQYLQSVSPAVPQSPQDMMAVADSIAQQLLGMPEGQKDSELRKLKTANEVLHSVVRARLDAIRRDTRNQAGGAALQQRQQQGG